MKNFESEKVRELVKTDNRFIFGTINFADGTTGVDTIWRGFKGKRELRGPRIGPLLPEAELKKWEEYLGINTIIIDNETFYKWINCGDCKKAKGRAIFHVAFLEEHFPSMLQTSHSIESLEHGGFHDEKTDVGKKLARNHLSPEERRKVMAEFEEKCCICKSTEKLTIHHIRERQHGGGTELLNCVPVCEKCHEKINTGEIGRPVLELLRYRKTYEGYWDKLGR